MIDWGLSRSDSGSGWLICGKQLLDGCKQFLPRERFSQRSEGTEALGIGEKRKHPAFASTRHGNDFEPGEFPAEFPDRLQSILLGHENIRDDQVGRVLAKKL